MTRPAVLEHLPWRITGLLLLGALVVLYQHGQQDWLQRLAIPVAMALAAWLLVQKTLAVAVGAGLLAAIHGDPGASDWITGRAYPVLAAVCAIVVLTVATHRFRRHIATTHEARWRHRRGNDDEPTNPRP